ncbi:MAG: BatA domain-containing protein [Planctomycetaceae bacterium]|jgi:hypothetical protein|nr:BatA domain-containing protein [Planctomycetaceae bacterium]
MFGLTTPLYLVGLLSAAIPLLIHLSRSRKTRTLRFSTTRFLTDQFLRSYRMSRLKELLLLAARMALCALLAMTFAEPFFKGAVAEGDASQSRSVVIVLDDSASMLYRDADGGTLLSRAAREAAAVIKELKPSDSASIVLAGRRAGGPLAEYREPTTDRAAVENSLLSLADTANSADGLPEALGTDLPGSVLLADRMLKDRDEASHEIYVFSDLQRRGFSAPALAGESEASFDARVVFVPIRPTAPVSNLAITAVQYGAVRPMAGIPFSIRPHIRNDGAQPRSCTVSLHVRAAEGADDVDDEGYRKVAEQEVPEPIESGRWGVLTLHHTFNDGGWQSGYVAVDDERLTADNRRYFSFEVLEAVNVVAVNGSPSSIRRKDELFFLQAALSAGGSEVNPIEVRSVRVNAFQAAPLEDVRLVVMANVESLPEAAVAKLERFVDRGGSLLVFLGNQVQPAFYNKRLADPSLTRGGLLPATISGAVPQGQAADNATAATIGDFSADHPALAGFSSGETGTLGGITLSTYWKLDTATTRNTRVLMKTDGGDPLLCERNYGGGRVALFASSCDRDWTNFPVRPAFLPFVYRLVGHLAQSASGQQTDSVASGSNFFQTGQPLRQAVPVGGQAQRLRIVKPDRSTGVFSVSSDPTSREVAFSETGQPGVYRVEAPNTSQAGRSFAVNLEAGESDLVSIDTGEGDGDQLREILTWVGAERLAVIDDATQLGGQAGIGRGRARLWEILMWVVLCIALLEPALANWITSRHYLKPRGEPRTIAIPTGQVALGGDLNDLGVARTPDPNPTTSVEESETVASAP